MNTTIHTLTLACALLTGTVLSVMPDAVDAHRARAPAQAYADGPQANVRANFRGPRALRIAADPALAAMRQMRLMERIYLRQNHAEAAEHMYRDVLDRAQDIRLRNFVNMRLARVVSWQPRNLEPTLVELKRGLDENLARVK